MCVCTLVSSHTFQVVYLCVKRACMHDHTPTIRDVYICCMCHVACDEYSFELHESCTRIYMCVCVCVCVIQCVHVYMVGTSLSLVSILVFPYKIFL